MEIVRDGEPRWNRLKKLGEGMFASVYLATTNPFKKSFLPSEIAVKSVKLSDSKKVCSLKTETDIFRALQGSPYIIGCYGTDVTIQKEEKESKPCEYLNVLLEYASLGSLKERISKIGCLSEAEVRHHTRYLLKGLKYIHDHGYVHCDLKPDNILLVASSSSNSSLRMIPKIADFGLASPVGKSLKEDCGTKGTPVYMAPESVERSEYEPKSDVWGMGCVVLEMLSANEPSYCGGVPTLPDRISEEARDFLMHCFVTEANVPRFCGGEVRWSIEMLMCHPFVAEESVHSNKVASTRSPLDQISCSSCVTVDKMASSSIPQSVINILSSIEDYDLHDRQSGKRRKIYNEAKEKTIHRPSLIVL